MDVYSSLVFTLNISIKSTHQAKNGAVFPAVWGLEKLCQTHLWMSNLKNRLCEFLFLCYFIPFLQVVLSNRRIDLLVYSVALSWWRLLTKLPFCDWVTQNHNAESLLRPYYKLSLLKVLWVPQGEKYFRPGTQTVCGVFCTLVFFSSDQEASTCSGI